MKTYKVTFKDGRTATYTAQVLSILRSDPDVAEIQDNQTGEIIKTIY